MRSLSDYNPKNSLESRKIAIFWESNPKKMAIFWDFAIEIVRSGWYNKGNISSRPLTRNRDAHLEEFCCRRNMHKQFKTIEEQIELLKSRGLSIPDEPVAKKFLIENNYYRVSGYSLTLRTNDVFHEGSTFQNIIDIYNFDHELRHILMKYIETIEVKLKSVFVHEFSKIYGPEGYLDPRNFTDPLKQQEIIAKTEKLKAQRLPHEAYLKHYISELKTTIPFWAYVELFSISDISFFLKISNEQIKESVAPAFNIPAERCRLLENFMHSMTILRNLCAHGSRIFNRFFEQKPKLSSEEKELLLLKDDGTVDNEHLFSYVLVMRRLLDETQFAGLIEDISTLSQKYPFVRMDYYGFPKEWSVIFAKTEEQNTSLVENVDNTI